MVDGIGLSVGATNLTAVVVGRAAVTRSPVLTLYPHRRPEVGVPSENPDLTERGLVITDFVERVGDPVGILASDGSSHQGEILVADALGALLRALTRGRQVDDPIAITHPAHWRPNQIDALRSALTSVREFASEPALVSDATAALVALQNDPGVPTRGVIALCDFGGSGTSITLADAARGYQPIAPTVRHPDLSGDLIDQALLTHIVNDLSAAGTIDLASTSAIGSLGRLRGECRRAKERLSTDSVTSLVAELPGHRSEVRLNRNELDEAIGAPLAEFVAVLQDTVERSGVRPGDLVAVATIGGGARIPAITTALSQHFQLPVITGAQPELTAAIGGGLTAVRGTAEEGMTALAPAAAAAPATQEAAAVAPEPPPAPQALAWSDAEDIPDVAPTGYEADFADYDESGPGGSTTARPRMQFSAPELSPHDEAIARPWYRRPAVALGVGGAAALAAVAAVVLLVGNGDAENPEPTSTSGSVTSTTAPAEAPAPAEQAPVQDAPAQQPQTVTREAPAPETVTETAPASEAPPPPAETPPPTSEAPPPPPPTSEAPPPTSEAPPATPPAWTPTAPYPTVPGLPWVPAPGGAH
ncbi:Hsp70 family protein [Mycolicibacterium sp.]|uniref:Hsp70 family protein n=1 Tax=Mycolicibacterium sp. TaxID=2320850 RepID=UPI0037CA20DB|nr:Hsp70 family protein [Mycobacterium sp. DSM 3803]